MAHWKTDGFINSPNTWIRIQVSYDHTSTANNPVIQINGNSAAGISEIVAPSGTYVSDEGLPLHINQIPSISEYPLRVAGYVKDTRLYNRILTIAEGATLYGGQNDYDILPDGLVFQGFAVRTSELDDYIPGPIEENMKIRDNIYGTIGTTHHNAAVSGAEITGADPSSTSY